MSNAGAAQHVSIAFSNLFGQDALHASYQHPLAGLAMLGVVAAVLAVPVGVRRRCGKRRTGTTRLEENSRVVFLLCFSFVVVTCTTQSKQVPFRRCG